VASTDFRKTSGFRSSLFLQVDAISENQLTVSSQYAYANFCVHVNDMLLYKANTATNS